MSGLWGLVIAAGALGAAPYPNGELLGFSVPVAGLGAEPRIQAFVTTDDPSTVAAYFARTWRLARLTVTVDRGLRGEWVVGAFDTSRRTQRVACVLVSGRDTLGFVGELPFNGVVREEEQWIEGGNRW